MNKGAWVMSANLNIRVPEWLDKICVCPLLVYRRLKFGEPFRKICLEQGVYTIVDPDVYYEKCQYNWFISSGTKAYAARTIKIGPRKISRSLLHREIVKPRKGKLVDHRDNNSLNNLRSNLRQATRSQNTINRPKRQNTSSRYNGVSWYKERKKWRVAIRYMKNGRPIIKHIGYFDDEIDAARAYDCAALKYHGEFARLNFPREDYVKVGNNYKFVGKPAQAEGSTSLRDKLNKIYSSILKRFVK
jgi:hypothetical protein